MLLDGFLALVMVLGIGFLLLLSMSLTALISAFYGRLEEIIAIPGFVLQFVNLAAWLAMVVLLFAMVFKLLPDVKIRWRDVGVGALGTALLFVAGEWVLSLYLGSRGIASGYGAAGSVVVILMWIYYSALILFLGAEFTRAYAAEKGSPLRPGRFAIPMNERRFPGQVESGTQGGAASSLPEPRRPSRPAAAPPAHGSPRPQEG